MSTNNLFQDANLLVRNVAASGEEIDAIENKLGIQFPLDYKQALLIHNGCEGYFGKVYTMLYSTDDIMGVSEWFYPEMICIGSDGAGEAFCFDIRRSPFAIVIIPFTGSLTDAIFVAKSFTSFIDLLKAIRDEETIFDVIKRKNH